MMKLSLAVLLLSPLSASAQLAYVGPAELRSAPVAVAEPPSRPADVIARSHMLAHTAKEVVYGYADTADQFTEATAYWSGVLSAAGIRPGTATLKDGIWFLPYRTADGRVLRDFMADPKQFPPKDDAGLRANMAVARQALSAAGLTPASARVLNLEFLLPTYQLLYLAKAEDKPEHETLLRVLKPGNDLDAGLIAASGVTVVQKPEPWMLVYVGPELGCVGLWAKTAEALQERLAKRKAFLVEQGKKIIGEKLVPIDDAEYKFGAELMFFQ